MQVVGDSKLRILNLVARWPGSTHDARIFNESTVKTQFEDGHIRGLLLGDSAYPLTPYLITPVLAPNTPEERRFNDAHVRTRVKATIEAHFTIWAYT